MDSAIVGRKYQSYSTNELRAFVAQGRGNPVMVQEVADRESGKSLTLHQRLQAAAARIQDLA